MLGNLAGLVGEIDANLSFFGQPDAGQRNDEEICLLVAIQVYELRGDASTAIRNFGNLEQVIFRKGVGRPEKTQKEDQLEEGRSRGVSHERILAVR